MNQMKPYNLSNSCNSDPNSSSSRSSDDDRFSLSEDEDLLKSSSSLSEDDDSNRDRYCEDDEGTITVSTPINLQQRVEINKQRNADRLRSLGLISEKHKTKIDAIHHHGDVSTRRGKHKKKVTTTSTSYMDSNTYNKSRGMIFSKKTFDTSNVSLHNLKNILHTMQHRFIHRDSQLQILYHILHTHVRLTQSSSTSKLAYTPPPIFITGTAATGKTTILQDMLLQIQRQQHHVAIAYVDLKCIESPTIPYLLQQIYHQLHQSFLESKETTTATTTTTLVLDKNNDDDEDDNDTEEDLWTASEPELEDFIEIERKQGNRSRIHHTNGMTNTKKGTNDLIEAPTILQYHRIPNVLSLGRLIDKLFTAKKNSCAFVVLDHVEIIDSLTHQKHRGRKERNNIFAQLLLMPHVLNLPLTLIAISRNVILTHLPMNNFQNQLMSLGSVDTAICPIQIHFPAYVASELRNILLLPRIQELITGQSPDTHYSNMSELYKSMINVMIQSMEHVTRNLNEYIRQARLLWPVYLSLGLSDTGPDSQLMKETHVPDPVSMRIPLESIRKHVRNLLTMCLPAPGRGYDPLHPVAQGNMTAYLIKFLLLAAYICQKNKSVYDEALFTDKNQGRKNKRFKDASEETTGPTTSRMSSFPLERLLSVFSSIVCKYGQGFGRLAHESDGIPVSYDFGTASFFRMISQLRQWNLLVSNDKDMNDRLLMNLSCTLSSEDAMSIANDVGFPLASYLSEEK